MASRKSRLAAGKRQQLMDYGLGSPPVVLSGNNTARNNKGSSGLSVLSAENSHLSSLYWVDLNGPLATEWSALQPSFCEEGAATHTTSLLVNIEGAPENA
jgi:hypothetical protein